MEAVDDSRHGRRYMYKVLGCRCPKCQEWCKMEARAYRKRRMARTGEIMLHGRFYLPEEVVKDDNQRIQG